MNSKIIWSMKFITRVDTKLIEILKLQILSIFLNIFFEINRFIKYLTQYIF
jgi:hypothetical protein